MITRIYSKGQFFHHFHVFSDYFFLRYKHHHSDGVKKMEQHIFLNVKKIGFKIRRMKILLLQVILQLWNCKIDSILKLESMNWKMHQLYFEQMYCFQESKMKMSFSMSSLQPSDNAEGSEHAKPRAERPYNSLTKKR